MLRYWQSHREYRFFLHETKVHFDSSHAVGFPLLLRLPGKNSGF